MPMRVCSSTSARTASRRSTGAGSALAAREQLLVGGVEPAAVGERAVEHAGEAGRGVGDDLGRVAQALGILEPGHRVIDLRGGVRAPARSHRASIHTAAGTRGVSGRRDA